MLVKMQRRHGGITSGASLVWRKIVGSNNINLLEPNGQFGIRIMGGSDASSRYINTELNKLCLTI